MNDRVGTMEVEHIMRAVAVEAGFRWLLVKDLLLPVPGTWTMDPPSQVGSRAQVSLHFALNLEPERFSIDLADGSSTSPSGHEESVAFDGMMLIECEPTSLRLDDIFASRMATFRQNRPTARVTCEGTTKIAGQRARLIEHVLTGPDGVWCRHRLIGTVYRECMYFMGTTNAVGRGFQAAARAFDGCVAGAAWCTPEPGAWAS